MVVYFCVFIYTDTVTHPVTGMGDRVPVQCPVKAAMVRVHGMGACCQAYSNLFSVIPSIKLVLTTSHPNNRPGLFVKLSITRLWIAGFC